MALEANRQKETRTQRQSFLFQFSQWNLERILFILCILLKNSKSNELPTGPPVVCLNGGGNVGGVGKGGEGCDVNCKNLVTSITGN